MGLSFARIPLGLQLTEAAELSTSAGAREAAKTGLVAWSRRPKLFHETLDVSGNDGSILPVSSEPKPEPQEKPTMTPAPYRDNPADRTTVLFMGKPVPVSNVAKLAAANARQLDAMRETASRTDRKVNGYTVGQLTELAAAAQERANYWARRDADVSK